MFLIGLDSRILVLNRTIYIYIYLRALGTWPRLLLIDLGFFGDVEALTLRQCLAVAYKDFRIWCRLNKVKCGQQLFRESTVSWPVDVHHDIYLRSSRFM